MAKSKTTKKSSSRSGGNLLGRSKGVSIYAIVAIIVMLSGVGIYLKFFSHASTNYLTAAGCQLRGRNWVGGTGNPCGSTCIKGSGTLITNATYNYCSNTESKLTSTQCSSLGRAWLVDGCARRYDQRTTANAPQCLHAGATYTVANPYDKCSGGSLGTSSAGITCGTGLHLEAYYGYVNAYVTYDNATSSAKSFTTIFSVSNPHSPGPVVYTKAATVTVAAHAEAAQNYGPGDGYSYYPSVYDTSMRGNITVNGTTIVCATSFD